MVTFECFRTEQNCKHVNSLTCFVYSKIGNKFVRGNIRIKKKQCSFSSVDVIAIASGPHHVVAIGSEGEVFSWGSGADGRLGLGTEDDQ